MKREVIPEIRNRDLEVMDALLRSEKLEHKKAIRLLIVINRARGRGTKEIAGFLGVGLKMVSMTVRRYNEGGIGALVTNKTKRPGREPISETKKNELCELVCKEKPRNATHWSLREIAKQTGISKSAVGTILHERGIKPHLVKKFQYSTDKQFKEKLEDVVGLYMNPPENAIVLCVDEKSQIQALERTQPILPLREHMPAAQTVDYERKGTTTLFAALEIITGNVIGECKQRQTSADYIAFLKEVDRSYDPGKTLHIVVDNLSAHKAQVVKDYLASIPGRFEIHYIPTHSSWLNQIERWFAELTNKQIRRGSWHSVDELKDAIKDYIIGWNKNSKPFTWKKSAEDILHNIEKTKTGMV